MYGRERIKKVNMLSEFKCRKCQERFLVGLRNAEEPIKHCVCCGSESLEFLGTEEDLAVRIKKVLDEYNLLF